MHMVAWCLLFLATAVLKMTFFENTHKFTLAVLHKKPEFFCVVLKLLQRVDSIFWCIKAENLTDLETSLRKSLQARVLQILQKCGQIWKAWIFNPQLPTKRVLELLYKWNWLFLKQRTQKALRMGENSVIIKWALNLVRNGTWPSDELVF